MGLDPRDRIRVAALQKPPGIDTAGSDAQQYEAHQGAPEHGVHTGSTTLLSIGIQAADVQLRRLVEVRAGARQAIPPQRPFPLPGAFGKNIAFCRKSILHI